MCTGAWVCVQEHEYVYRSMMVDISRFKPKTFINLYTHQTQNGAHVNPNSVVLRAT